MKIITRHRLATLATAVALTMALVPGPVLAGADADNLTVTTQAVQTALTAAAEEPEQPAISLRPTGLRREAIVVMGRDVELKAEDSAETVVVIGGSATIRGKVREAVVAIGGSVNVEGEVGDTTVAVFGDVKLGPHAVAHRDIVTVGGRIEVADGAKVNGHVQEIDIRWSGLTRFEGLKDWFKYCVAELRPLAPQVSWVWPVAGVFFLFYLVVALVFGRPVQVCVEELTRRPATTFFVGLLAEVLIPVLLLLLAVTVVGLLVVPFFLAALLFGAIIGKVALLEYLGKAIGKPFVGPALQPLFALVLGAALVTVLYLVPVLGFVMFAVLGLWGLGSAVTAAFGSMRREAPQPPAPCAPAPPAPFLTVPAATPADAGAGEGTEPDAPGPIAPAVEPPIPTSVPAPLAYPRAGFWLRMGAGFLDAVLVCFLIPVIALVSGPLLVVPVALAYFAGLWAWKGTTIGGIVLKLQVMRQDGNPLTFMVALVRALAAAFSGCVFFLGFFWIGWDRDKQGWHDKIAGTIVVRLPHSRPLV